MRTVYSVVREDFLGEYSDPRNAVVTPHQIRNLERRIEVAIPDFHRCFFGMKASVAAHDYSITPQGYFEAADDRVLMPLLEEIRALIDSGRSAFSTILEPFVGIGQATQYFASAGFALQGAEIHPFTYQCAVDNLRRKGCFKNIQILNQNGLDLLAHLDPKDKSDIAAVYLDPPWSSKHYERDVSISLSRLFPDLEDVIRCSFEISGLVILKIPRNISYADVENLARKLHCFVKYSPLHVCFVKPQA